MSSEKLRIIVDRTKIEKQLEQENQLLRQKLAVLDSKEQAIRDTISINSQRGGGGVVSLHQTKRDVYPTIWQGISDLYKRQAQGSQQASDILRKMWDKSRQALLEIESSGMHVFACPKCNTGIERKSVAQYQGKCPSCSFSLVDFKSKGGIW